MAVVDFEMDIDDDVNFVVVATEFDFLHSMTF